MSDDHEAVHDRHETVTRHTEWVEETRRYRRGPGGWWWAALLLVPALLAAIGSAMGTGSSTAAPSASGTHTTVVSSTPSVTPSSSPAPAPAADLTVLRDGNTITVTGHVPDAAAKKSLIDGVTALAGGATVVDQVTVEAGAPAVDPAAWGALVSTAKDISGFSGAESAGAITLTGEAASEGVKAAAATAAAAVVKGGAVTNNLTVAAGAGDACATLGTDIRATLAATKITFATGGSTVTPASVAVLRGVGAKVKACPAVGLVVTGYTDNVGDPGANKVLSAERAASVKAVLVAAGVAPAKIATAGLGQAKPVASNSTDAGRAANRRVEITVR